MQKSRIRFKGHESFIIREGWLNKGLQEIHNNPEVFRENFGADALGVGPNMAKAIRFWLRCSGLTRECGRNETALTRLGQMLLERDPYFEDVFSLWVIHCNIARNRKQATAWELFFNSFSYEEFTRVELEREMQELAKAAAGAQKFSEKSVQDDCDAILRMYIRKREKNSSPEEKNISPFGRLGLLKKFGDVYTREQPDLGRIPADTVLYLMADCMKGQKGIRLEELMEMDGGPGKILHLRRLGLAELLERLEAEQVLIQNRTAGLDMVYFAEEISRETVLERHYTEGNRKNRGMYL